MNEIEPGPAPEPAPKNRFSRLFDRQVYSNTDDFVGSFMSRKDREKAVTAMGSVGTEVTIDTPPSPEE